MSYVKNYIANIYAKNAIIYKNVVSALTYAYLFFGMSQDIGLLCPEKGKVRKYKPEEYLLTAYKGLASQIRCQGWLAQL